MMEALKHQNDRIRLGCIRFERHGERWVAEFEVDDGHRPIGAAVTLSSSMRLARMWITLSMFWSTP